MSYLGDVIMFSGCELYSYSGLLLNELELKKLQIYKTDSIGAVTLIQNYSNVSSMELNKTIDDYDYIPLDKSVFLKQILSSSKEICYRIVKDSVIILPVQIHYGISDGERILALYDEKNIRDAKLSTVVKINKINSIIEDITNSNSLIQTYNKQKELRRKGKC